MRMSSLKTETLLSPDIQTDIYAYNTDSRNTRWSSYTTITKIYLIKKIILCALL